MNFLRGVKVVISISAVCSFVSCACICPDDLCKSGEQAFAEDMIDRRVASLSVDNTLRVGGTSDSGTAGPLRSIHFDYKKTAPIESDLANLEIAVHWLINNPDAIVTIEGHCDRVGSDRYNSGLSKSRAESVREMLIAAGIEASRLKIRLMGRSLPISGLTATSAFEWAKDRRINFVIDSLGSGDRN